ncbi:hypothetical protein AALP_AAs71644U000100, partial [Arabis alpina]
HLCLPDQRDALWEFKNEFYVDSTNFKWSVDSDVTNFEKMTEKWRNNTDCCSWDGVSCDPRTGKIVELDLINSALNDSIGNLKYLSRLRCRTCNLHGEIPSSLGNLSYLADLDLAKNHFTSEGPNLQLVLPKLRSLISINLGYNQFKEESISLGLRSLDVGHNQLSGELPKSLINCTYLEFLNVEGNIINDTFPFGLGKLTFLERMNFSYNMLEGPIPQGTQIQSQNSSSFAENPGICGAPLQDSCGGGGEEEATKQEQDEEKEQVLSWTAAAIAYVLSRQLYLPAKSSAESKEGDLPLIVAIDLQPMAPIEGVIQVQGDITNRRLGLLKWSLDILTVARLTWLFVMVLQMLLVCMTWMNLSSPNSY